jgi:threonine aldolase
VRIAYPVEANGVFAVLPQHAIAPLQAVRRFYVWDESASIVRWMCSFDTTEDDVDSFADAVAREVAR